MSYLGQVELKSSEIRRIDVTGSTSATHTLTWTPPSEQSLIITINGVKQQNNYSFSGTTLTLDTALIVTDAMEVIGILDIGEAVVPPDDSITNAMVKSDAAIALSKLATDPSNASNLASGTVPTARLGSGSASSSTILYGNNTWAAPPAEYNDAGLQDDIALLGFQVAANGSLAKYNLVDQTVDAFETEAGVDLSTSTGEYYSSSGTFYSGAEAESWFDGDRNSGANLLTVSTDMSWYDTAPQLDIQSLVNGDTTYSNAGGSWFNAGGNGYIRFDHGSGNSKVYTNSRWSYGHCTVNEGTWKWQGSADAGSWTDIGGTFVLTAVNSSADTIYTDTHATMTANTTGYRYYQCVHVSGNSTNGGGRRTEMQFYGAGTAGDMVLVSNATVAEAAPSKGDIVITWTDGAGTATLGTDLTAEFSADNGSNWTAMTLVDKGTTGSHNIASAHEVTRTSASGTNMRWRVKTLNQSASKETRIQAVSLGWT